ncbi:MAG: flavin prenyltransferase UbiX [Candidatus Caenarcaniphilales bacterium]|nr:flavin prenyltransferase UbiX [Candidatus Caenarcaniphilales bacterium]
MRAITIAITGASGSIYGFKALGFLLSEGYTVDLIFSETANKVISIELGLNLEFNSVQKNKKTIVEYLSESLPKGVNKLNAEKLNLWEVDNLAAKVASGSYRNEGMIIIPCSMGTIGRIANGTSEDLISRCADVCLKEKSKLVIVPRETPFNSIHLRNMLTISESGGMIVPAMPAFYHKPKSMDDLVNFVVGKTLDAFGVDNQLFTRWLEKNS